MKRGLLGLAALAAVLVLAYGSRARHGPALADEFIYLAGARHFSTTGDLNARFYDADAILRKGYPHHDVHTPGYVLLLGSAMAVAKGTYWTAVALNVVGYVGSALLVAALGRCLGSGNWAALAGGVLYLVLPTYLAYVYWAMAEVVLGTLFLAALVTAGAWGDRRWGALATGVLFGAGVLVRESVLLALPAVLGLLVRRGRVRWFVVSAGAFLAFVYCPLSGDRAPGGANFWEPTGGRAFAHQVVQAGASGEWSRAVDLAIQRARANVGDLVSRTSWTERGFLLLFAGLPCSVLPGWRRRNALERRFLSGLLASFLAMSGLLLFIYTLGQWSGFRYLMFLMPAFLPWVGPRGRRSRLLAVATGVICLGLILPTFRMLDAYKTSRQGRQARLTEYVERYVAPRSVRRIVLRDGWLFGLKHYPVEVISSLPSGGGGALRALERALSFEILVLPRDSPLAPEIDGRKRYRRLNGGTEDAPVFVYRRLS